MTKYIKRKFDVDPHLQDIWVKGELSNLKMHSRGHMYFTLKDENARIQGVMFAGQNRSLKFRPENGMKVLLRGEIAVYESSGGYQIYAKELQPDGIGSLYLAYEELKKKLEKEGLFDPVHKKPIPRYPSQIGVITSPTGAAVRDIITTIKRRYPIARVLIIPALVQGVNAGKSVADAIAKANAVKDLDVLIVGRGGGSIEELWGFNEEAVAREIFKSKIPVISAVGHETDFTIADFVADLRAPTPTGAAELAVPHFSELAERISNRTTMLTRRMNEKMSAERERLDRLQKSYAFRFPRQLYEQKEQQLDAMLERLQRGSLRALEKKQNAFKESSSRLKTVHPHMQIQRAAELHQALNKKLQREMVLKLKGKQSEFEAGVSKLEALSPLKVMERGFSLVYKKEQLLKTKENVTPGDHIKVRLQDGILHCEVKEIEEREKNG
nr:exodeoxyribonuclease VII large subunit [Metabacillus lacus]